MAPTLSRPRVSLTLGGAPAGLSPLLRTVIISDGILDGWGMEWTGRASDDGTLPEYFRDARDRWVAVPASEVPPETRLAEQVFPSAPRGHGTRLDRGPSSPWNAKRWSAGPFRVTLVDSSTVEYAWYRFVDQPAIARLGLGAAAAARLQRFAESFHEHTGAGGLVLAPPPGERLATLDPALTVTPPPGLEKGHVPVVIGQRPGVP